jgi:hypothetical protein
VPRALDIIERIHERGALIKILDKPTLISRRPWYAASLPSYQALAEDERQGVVCRASAARKAARAKGVKFGRKPS